MNNTQLGDTLIVGHDIYTIHSGPALPVRHLGVRHAFVSELSALDDRCAEVECQRGYLATWLVRDNRLLLVDLLGRYRLTCGGPLAANWYTGLLRATTPASHQQDSADAVRRQPVALTQSAHTEYRFQFKSGMLLGQSQIQTGNYVELSLSA